MVFITGRGSRRAGVRSVKGQFEKGQVTDGAGYRVTEPHNKSV